MNKQHTGCSRRKFIMTTAMAATVLAVAPVGLIATPSSAAGRSFAPPALLYPENALEPSISARTVSFHYGKHTAGYYANTGRLTAGTPFAAMSLEEIILATAGKESETACFNNAAQALNHTFYWNGMLPGGAKEPQGRLRDALLATFGSLDGFKKAFAKAGATQFGSGWAWLAEHAGQLKIVHTPNAMTPLAQGMTPLLTMDVWEHAYYLDYQNRRADYIRAFLDNLINWDLVSANLG